MHVAGLVLSLISGIWLYYYPTWWSVIIGLLCKGVGMYSRLSISYLYTLEMFDEERCKIVAMVIMAINNALSCVMASYLMLGGRNATMFLLLGNIVIVY